jgi:CheY-like chemotaxis protein
VFRIFGCELTGAEWEKETEMQVESQIAEAAPPEILLVEDNHGDVLLARRAFRDAGAVSRLSVADSAEQALARLQRDKGEGGEVAPDMILLDLNLPGMSGHELLKLLKQDRELRRIPVMVLSSSKAPEDILKSYALHANGYLVKPAHAADYSGLVAAMEQFWFEFAMLPTAPAMRPPS